MATITWTGSGGDNNWDNAANWSGGVLPGAGDDAVIPTSGIDVFHYGGTDAIESLSMPGAGAVLVLGGVLAVASASSVNAMGLYGGTVELDGATTLAGPSSWTARPPWRASASTKGSSRGPAP